MQVIVVPNVEEPLMVRKSDGGFLYGTTDMAALKQRIQVGSCNPLLLRYLSAPAFLLGCRVWLPILAL